MTVKGNNITLTRKELTEMLQNAAEIALRQAGVTISDVNDSENQPSKEIKIGEFTDEQYADAMHTMELNRGMRPDNGRV